MSTYQQECDRYGGPIGRAMRQYLSDNNYATIDVFYVTIDNNDVTIEDKQATLPMRRLMITK